VVTLHRPNLKPSSGFAMAKAKRQSNNPDTKPPAELPPGWRPSSKFPGYIEVDDSSPWALPKPALTQLWREEVMPEFVRVQLQMVHHIAMESQKGRHLKHEEIAALFETKRLSNGRLISPNQAKMLATFCRPVEAMTGGNKKRVKPLNP
jgi:hypothetical protein